MSDRWDFETIIIWQSYDFIALKFGKVRISWEDHKIWKNLPLKIWCYWVASNFKWKICFNFVAFSEYPNFNVFCFHKYINDVWCATYAKKNEFICIPRKLSCLWIINMYEKWSYLPKYIHILEKRRETIQWRILMQ